MKWIIGIIVLAAAGAGVWWSGIADPWLFPQVPTAPAVEEKVPNPSGLPTAATDTSDTALSQDGAVVDAELQLLVSDIVSVEQTLVDKVITPAQQEIDRRVAALQVLATRMQATRKITQEFKQNLNTNIEAQVSGLTALKNEITTATSTTAVKAGEQTVAEAYRVFSLLMPQGTIAAAADRVVVSIDMMIGIGNKLQTLISAAASTGDATALQILFADLGTQLTTAQTKAQSAVTASAVLSPDNGAKVAASNVAVLKTARTDLQDARAALVKARQDIVDILQALRSPNLGATTTVEVQ